MKKALLHLMSRVIPIEVDASEIVDLREVPESNLSVKDIEEGFERVFHQLNPEYAQSQRKQ